MKKTKWIISFTALVALTFAGCKKDFWDINKNPNDPENADIKLVLPNAQAYTAYVMGNYYQLWGGLWSQYWTQSPDASQYKEWDKYVQSNNEMDRPWSQMYAGVLSDLDYIETKATAEGKPNWAAIAKIMKAYSYQYLTDCHGDIPFSNALKGANNFQPTYDDQKTVYAGIEKLLVDAAAMIDINSSVHPGAEDMYFGGDMEHWLEFANTLRLRVYLRQSETTEATRCKDSVGAMVARGDLFLSTNVMVSFSGSLNQKNPLNTTQNALNPGNLLGSSTVIDSMKSYNDPRLGVLFNKPTAGSAPNLASWFGFEQGKAGDPTYVLGSNSYRNWSTPSAAVGGAAVAGKGGDAPVYIMTEAETNFLLAEAYARNWAVGSDGTDEYDYAIEASFTQWGLDNTDLATYLADSRVVYPTSQTDRLKAIGTQKWFAFCGSQNCEAWIEWRRTGYPNFFKTSVSSKLAPNKFPVRFVYPNAEITRNPNANAKYKEVDVKVWWDVN